MYMKFAGKPEPCHYNSQQYVNDYRITRKIISETRPYRNIWANEASLSTIVRCEFAFYTDLYTRDPFTEEVNRVNTDYHVLLARNANARIVQKGTLANKYTLTTVRIGNFITRHIYIKV